MLPPLLSPRERLVWTVGFVAISALIVATGFTSTDADSLRYATISEVLATLPAARWVAPEWWGLSPDNPLTGYFLEHPAGLFWAPAALAWLGVPAGQAPYIFGVAAGLVALLLSAKLVGRLASREAGRGSLVLLQVMPVAFVFRVRDNHEYPMLICLLAALIGLHGVSRSWMWGLWVIAGFTAGLLIKGVFVGFVLMGAALWIAVNPTSGSRARQVAVCVAALLVMALAAVGYDAWYARITGGPFWSAYWERQLGPMDVASPLGDFWAFAQHAGFYLGLLLFHPAPWSLALVWAALRGGRLPGAHEPRRGLVYVLLFTAASVLLLSLASRFAERYAFSTTYLMAAAGSAVAYAWWPGLRDGLARAEARIPAFPALVWMLLVGLRLLLGPWLPRIQ
jgi:4-amino-4-deoxy-L-arabinose transferase-like glycosyltransferase